MPNGAAHHWFYNAIGDIHLYMDPLGHATRLVWDEQGDCLQQTDPGGSITRYRYNTRGQLTRYIFGQITGRTDPAGHRPGFRYDRFGRLKALVNEKEESHRFEYDALHRLTREKSRLFLRLTLIKNYFKIHNYFDK
ncbi:hypothetical protein BFD15_10635 [Morganella morganii]|nr:hypothetical protein [Morganella morganii]ROJ32562.1 hypothetical protein BFD15_10635 [Morganella morganii]